MADEVQRELFLIHCMDDLTPGLEEGTPRGGSVKRMSVYTEHKRYQAEANNPESPNYINKICAGPLVTDDGRYMIGSSIIVLATRAEAEVFLSNDPFKTAEVWGQITISKYFVPTGIKAVAPL